MTTVNLGVILLSNIYDDVNKECESILNTLNNVNNIAGIFIIGIVNSNPNQTNSDTNILINVIKDWGMDKKKQILIILSSKESVKNGYYNLGNKMLDVALDLKNNNQLDYILYLKSGETLKNIETIPQVINSIHSSDDILGLKLPIMLGSFTYKLRLFKASFSGSPEKRSQASKESEFKTRKLEIRFIGDVDMDLYGSGENIRKLVIDNNTLFINGINDSLSTTSYYKELISSLPKSIKNMYYIASINNDIGLFEELVKENMTPQVEEYFYNSFIKLAENNIDVFNNAERAYNIKKNIDPLLILAEYFMNKSNYDFAFLYAKKAITMDESHNLTNLYYKRWKLLAHIGLKFKSGISGPIVPEHFIYGKM